MSHLNIWQSFSIYRQTCVNDHLWTTATCLQQPAWKQFFLIESNLKNQLLNNSHFFLSQGWPLYTGLTVGHILNNDWKKVNKIIFLFKSIYDGATSSATLVAALCGHQLPATSVFTSTGNKMYIVFTTDKYSGVFTGFSATYTFVWKIIKTIVPQI